MRNVLFSVFALSGFSGLIYESIWTHYLKLFLGHAAHAQTLVLAIFMGGMAVGAAYAARRSVRWGNPLRAYAICEALVGLMALGFHPAFTRFLAFAYDHALPALESADAVIAFRWSCAAALILPQSILLGMTFPLMSAGILRRYPGAPGATLATLYFTNSIGGAAGVLLSGFVLVDRVGLPGTIAAAGIANLLLAALVWRLGRPSPAATQMEVAAAPAREPAAAPQGGFMVLMVAVSFLTGLSSLVYEIGWIRMLSLVLGSSTHAFELMLSAFISGLAFGGLWIRRRIDRLPSPIFALALVQVLMGILALATLPVYAYSFDAMAALMAALEKTERGYQLFNLGSHAIAFAVMLPATFCAGMTLPLATLALLSRGAGERSIGVIYSANTIGAIAGVAAGVHFGLPWLGLRDTIVGAAAIDLALGAGLMLFAGTQRAVLRAAACTGVAMLATATTVLTVRFDPVKLTSGVYREGKLHVTDNWTVIARRDGKTASISLVEVPSGVVSILTNGKPDASVNMASLQRPAIDEPTMILSGAIGPLLHPQARSIANIGFGSGLTTDTALAFRDVQRVDSIEIEPAMVELARGFYPRNARAYEDPRSRIHIDDAKSYFSTQRRRYDVIVSEPSNPWVSGVAGLFSIEFYANIKRHLERDGLLVQWLQLYEIDFALVASILKALDASFTDYAIYAANDGDVLVVASPAGTVPVGGVALPESPDLRSVLERAGVRSAEDIGLRLVANRRLIHPLLALEPVPVNSDYYPIVDQRAAKARFLGNDARALVRVSQNPVPVLPMLGGVDAGRGGPTVIGYSHFEASEHKAAAQRFATNPAEAPVSLAGLQDKAAAGMLAAAEACIKARAPDEALTAIMRIAYNILAYLPPEQVGRTIAWMETQPCGKAVRADLPLYLRLMAAASARDAGAMIEHSEKIIATSLPQSDAALWLVVGSGIVGRIAQGRAQEARALAQRHEPRLARLARQDLAIRVALAHSGIGIRNRSAGSR